MPSRCSTPTCAGATRPSGPARAYRSRPSRPGGLGDRPGARARRGRPPRAASPRRPAVGGRATARAPWPASSPPTRALFRALREHGLVAQNPADLVAAPKRGQKLPRVLDAEEVAALLDRIPASTPLELRDRAMFELAYASGLRAEELVKLDVGVVDFDAEEVRVEGKGSKTRIVPAGRVGAAGARRATPSAAARRSTPTAATAPTRRCSSRSPAAGSRPPTSAGACGCGRAGRAWPGRFTPTRCGTPSRPTCSTAAPTCAPSRSCSVTAPSRRPRSTLG